MVLVSFSFFQKNGGTGVRIALRHPEMGRINEVAEEVIALINELGEEVVEDT